VVQSRQLAHLVPHGNLLLSVRVGLSRLVGLQVWEVVVVDLLGEAMLRGDQDILEPAFT
jgi:hypothetical protein